jgi:23S rRNA (pseudouridine1915-N3)-methyltransferase
MPKGYEVARIAVKDDTRLRAALPRNARLVALDERGKDYTTAQFSRLLGAETVFVIGGPDGLDASIRQAADMLLRL